MNSKEIPDTYTADDINPATDCRFVLLEDYAALKKENDAFREERKDLIGELHRFALTEQALKARVAELEFAARSLRSSQKEYMLNRGNDEIGKSVAEAAKYLDEVLGASHDNQ